MKESTKKYNKHHLERLTQALKGGNVVGLVGAGSSIACGYPSWDQLVSKMENAAMKNSPSFRLHIDDPDLPSRVDEAAKILKKEFSEIFGRTFSKRDIKPEQIPEWIRLVFDLPLSILLTTNYTTELEEISSYHPSQPFGEKPEPPIRWYESERIAHALKRVDGRLRLIYLHGRIGDSPLTIHDSYKPWSKIILGEQSYKFAYETPGDVGTRFKALCQTSTLLVIGASLRDQDQLGCFRFLKALGQSKESPTYAIMPLLESSDPVTESKRLIDNYGIQPVFYDLHLLENRSEDHSLIESLLLKLTESVVKPNSNRHSIDSSRSEQTLNNSHEGFPQAHFVHPLLEAADFQPRPNFLTSLRKFVEKEQGGVLALVGIGGAGKTALVHELVVSLLGMKKRPVAGPFVWSFYDEPDSSSFLVALANYLPGKKISQDCNEYMAYDVVKNRIGDDPILIILDGLERIQIEQAGNIVHGNLQSPILLQFLLWFSNSDTRARTVITTRFPLSELNSMNNVSEVEQRVHIMTIDSLTRMQARNLLKVRGVMGSVNQMNEVLDHFGTHALTVDHLGGVISTYLEGKASLFRELGKGPLARFKVGQAGKKLGRVVAAYEDYLAKSELEVLRMLQCVAIFLRPIEHSMLFRVYERLLNPSIPIKLSKPQVLYRLLQLRLVNGDNLRDRYEITIHPAIRDSILDSLGTTLNIFAGSARQELESKLNRVPGVALDKKQDLDVVEDLIRLFVTEGQFSIAYRLYRDRMGGFKLSKLGDYARGERVTGIILQGSRTAGTPQLPKYFDTGRPELRKEFEGLVKLGLATPKSFINFLHKKRDLFYREPDRYLARPNIDSLQADRSLFLEKLGRNEEALEVSYGHLAELNRLYDVSTSESKQRIVTISANYQLGKLIDANQAAEDAWSRLKYTYSANLQWCSYWHARVALAIGEVRRAFELFQACLLQQNNTTPSINPNVLYALRGIGLQMSLIRCGDSEIAFNQLQQANLVNRKFLNSWPDVTAYSKMVEARIVGPSSLGSRLLQEARAWAFEKGRCELQLWCSIVAAEHSLTVEDNEGALELLREGLRMANSHSFRLLSLDVMNLLSRTYIELDRPSEARIYAQSALKDATKSECNYRWAIMDAQNNLAKIEELDGMSEAAILHRNDYLRIRSEILANSEKSRLMFDV